MKTLLMTMLLVCSVAHADERDNAIAQYEREQVGVDRGMADAYNRTLRQRLDLH
jgi:hypothetical protein